VICLWHCSEMAVFQQQQYATNLQSVPGHPGFLQTHIVQRPTSKYLNIAGHPPVAGQVCTLCRVYMYCTLGNSQRCHFAPVFAKITLTCVMIVLKTCEFFTVWLVKC